MRAYNAAQGERLVSLLTGFRDYLQAVIFDFGRSTGPLFTPALADILGKLVARHTSIRSLSFAINSDIYACGLRRILSNPPIDDEVYVPLAAAFATFWRGLRQQVEHRPFDFDLILNSHSTCHNYVYFTRQAVANPMQFLGKPAALRYRMLPVLQALCASGILSEFRREIF
jgi:hypothetical protein